MFGTIRYAGDNKDGDFEECGTGVVDGISTNKPQHLACDNCRVKKVCDGFHNGELAAQALISYLSRPDSLQRPKGRLFPMQNPPFFLHLFRPEAKEGRTKKAFSQQH